MYSRRHQKKVTRRGCNRWSKRVRKLMFKAGLKRMHAELIILSGLPCPENYITSQKKPDINDPVMLWLKRKSNLSTDWDKLANLVSGGPLACPASGHQRSKPPRSLVQRSSRWPISNKRSLEFRSQREPWIWSGHGVVRQA